MQVIAWIMSNMRMYSEPISLRIQSYLTIQTRYKHWKFMNVFAWICLDIMYCLDWQVWFGTAYMCVLLRIVSICVYNKVLSVSVCCRGKFNECIYSKYILYNTCCYEWYKRYSPLPSIHTYTYRYEVIQLFTYIFSIYKLIPIFFWRGRLGPIKKLRNVRLHTATYIPNTYCTIHVVTNDTSNTVHYHQYIHIHTGMR